MQSNLLQRVLLGFGLVVAFGLLSGLIGMSLSNLDSGLSSESLGLDVLGLEGGVSDAELVVQSNLGNDPDLTDILALSSWEKYREPNRQAVMQAKEVFSCQISEGILSPTGNLPNQANYHWKQDEQGNIDYSKMKSLDWGAKFGNPIYAPFSGTVTYTRRTKPNACGNQILIEGPTGSMTLCHVKDFVDDEGKYAQGKQVQQGEMIGHSGGKCCLGQSVPKNWITECQAEGVMCNDPTHSEDCQCQPALEAGNTTGPHVHTTLKSGGNILSCLL
jgi:hypothetical protein